MTLATLSLRSVQLVRPAWPATWKYLDDGKRDLRVDLLRGIVLCVMVIVHIEIFSWLDLLAWERVGLVSGAEGFVILSGLVLGQVQRRSLAQAGWATSAGRLWDRAAQLYRVNIAVIGSVLLLTYAPVIDTTSITTFRDIGANVVYPLFVKHDAPWWTQLASVLLLRSTPHQFQVIGLYVVLLAAAPVAVWAMSKGRTGTVLAVSWILYIKAWAFPAMLLTAQFEYAFPILTWQVLFIHGLALGYHRDVVMEWLSGRRAVVLVTAAVIATVAFAWLAQNNPNPFVPGWSRLSAVSANEFYSLYGSYFQKKLLGPGRLLNDGVLLLVTATVFTWCWTPIYRAVGWFFIPLGQATLYVFVVHVYLILAIANLPTFGVLTPTYGSGNAWVNFAVHIGALSLLWLMVKRQLFFRWIPR